MAYNLPPPWDPGYAIPDNVRDEGLERRAYVTKWMPRGTYDAPTVGSGGYVLPSNVIKEGYGQGTMTSKWLPRGTITQPPVPQWIQRQPVVAGQRSLGPGTAAVTFQRRGALSAFGDVDGSEAVANIPLFEEYGRRAAAKILAHVRMFPAIQHKTELKKVMDRIDPTLYARTANYAKQYVARGMSATEAVVRGLTRALSTGIAAEMVEVGRTGAAPQARSLLGLGCYGCSAAFGAAGLGDTAPVTKCGNPPPGLSWVPAAGAIPGHWERARSGVAPTRNPVDGNYCVTSSGQVSYTPKDPHVSIADNQAPAGPAPGVDMLTVGPLTFPGDMTKPWIITATSPTTIPAAWKPFIVNALTNKQLLALPSYGVFAKMAEKMTVPDNAIYKALGLVPGQKITARQLSPKGTTGKWSDTDDDAIPMATFKHPQSGNKWGIFVAPLPNKTAPTALQMYVKWLPDKPWYKDALGWIADLPVKVVKGVIEAVSELACKVATSPNAAQAGAAAGVATGAGASAGAAGASIVAGLCAQPVAPIPPPVAMPSGNLLPLAILGGGALLAVLLTKKKTP